jgi:hypothetical protein
VQDLDNDGSAELMVGTIGDSKASPNAGAIHLLYFGQNATDGLPYVRDWRKITTGQSLVAHAAGPPHKPCSPV